MAAWLQRGIPSAGLCAGPAAWFASHEARYALVPWVCANKLPLIHPVTAAAALIALFGAYLSWRALSGALYVVGVARLWRQAGLGRGVRLWQAACFAAGWTLLFGALVAPLHWLGERLFTAHMVEHEIL